MRLLRLEKCSIPEYWRQLYARNTTLADAPYSEQLAAYCYAGMQYAGAMHRELTPLGYDVMEAFTDVPPLQKAWARENGVTWRPGAWIPEIALAQVESFQPDVLFLQDLRTLTHHWIAEARRRCPRLRIVTGFLCSPSYDIETLRSLDFVLTCTKEYLEKFTAGGATTYYAQHVFDDAVLSRLGPPRQPPRTVVFSGSLWRHQLGHHEREAVLERMAGFPGFEIYCAQANLSAVADTAEWVARSMAYGLQQGLAAVGVPGSARRRIPLVGRAATWPGMPMRQLNRKLRSVMRPPVFGLDMFALLRDSRVCLNVVDHKEAANIRMFEATGVGTCLLTSYRPNMASMFDSDSEVVLFKSPDECWEKARWLADHPAECAAIGAKGQARTMRDYTFRHRAQLLDEIIRRVQVLRS